MREMQYRAGGSKIFEVFYDFDAGNKLVQVGVDVLRNPAIELIENSPGLSATLWLSGPVFYFMGTLRSNFQLRVKTSGGKPIATLS